MRIQAEPRKNNHRNSQANLSDSAAEPGLRNLVEDEQLYRDIFDHSPDGIYLLDVESLAVIQTNEAFRLLLGYSEEEAAILSVYDLVAASRESIDARINRLVLQGETVVGERIYRKKSGEVIPVWSRYNSVWFKNRLILCTRIHDYSDEKIRKEELRASEERFRLISENAADCIVLSTPVGECLYASPALKMLGYDPAGFRGRNVFEKIHPDDRIRFSEQIESVQSTFAHLSTEFLFQKQDASWLPMETTISLMIDDAGPKILMVMRDITERRQNEASISAALESLKRKNEEVERTVERLTQLQSSLVQSEKLASIGQLTAGIAHEINNPLAFVTSNLNRFTEYYQETRGLLCLWQEFGTDVYSHGDYQNQIDRLMEEGKKRDLEFIDRDFLELMNHTRDGSARIKRIVDQLRGFSHMTTNDIAMADVNQMLEETLTLVWNEIKYKATVSKEFTTLPQIPCNEGELKQVFVNLLVNAAHAITDKGSITLRTKQLGSSIQVEIADNGSGIPAELLKRIFDPFFTTKPVGKGTGLGLWIVSTIIEKHRGNILVESEVGIGTTFTLSLPVACVDSDKQL